MPLDTTTGAPVAPLDGTEVAISAALAPLGARLADLVAALHAIASYHLADAPTFATAVLSGVQIDDAWAADAAAIPTPNTPEEQAEIDRRVRRLAARDAIVSAALRLEDADRTKAGGFGAWFAAETDLYAAVRAYRAMEASR